MRSTCCRHLQISQKPHAARASEAGLEEAAAQRPCDPAARASSGGGECKQEPQGPAQVFQRTSLLCEPVFPGWRTQPSYSLESGLNRCRKWPVHGAAGHRGVLASTCASVQRRVTAPARGRRSPGENMSLQPNESPSRKAGWLPRPETAVAAAQGNSVQCEFLSSSLPVGSLQAHLQG